MLSALALAGAQKTPTIVAVAIPVVSFGLPVLETVLSVMRRFLSGQPLFTADRGHIHHKLLERGFSQRQVVLILYVVSAACGLLSLFLLYPSGPMIGIVLFVIGAGVWVGVQHLGYHEFLELGRVAHRTMEQKRIIFNDLTIRRATEALSRSNDMNAVERILRDTFETNDFDGFNLTLDPEVAGRLDKLSQLEWKRSNGSGHEVSRDCQWILSVDLKRSTGQNLGTFSVNRKCSGSPLFVDINLLISGFNVALAAALENALARSQAPFKQVSQDKSAAGNALSNAAK
jgi:hypothetical protein